MRRGSRPDLAGRTRERLEKTRPQFFGPPSLWLFWKVVGCCYCLKWGGGWRAKDRGAEKLETEGSEGHLWWNLGRIHSCKGVWPVSPKGSLEKLKHQVGTWCPTEKEHSWGTTVEHAYNDHVGTKEFGCFIHVTLQPYCGKLGIKHWDRTSWSAYPCDRYIGWSSLACSTVREYTH